MASEDRVSSTELAVVFEGESSVDTVSSASTGSSTLVGSVEEEVDGSSTGSGMG